MVVQKCLLHAKDGKRWIRLPFEKYTKPGGVATTYTAIVEFSSKHIATNFRRQVLHALEAEGLA